MKATYGVPENKNKINLGEAVPLNTPFLVCAEPTNFCNLKCTFCPSSTIDMNKKLFMPMSTFEKIIEDIKKFPSKPKVFRFTGVGEPLLHKNFADMVKMLKDNNSAEKIITYSNGVLLNPELNRKIVAAGLNQIFISVEAIDKEGFIKFAQTNVDFNKFVDNIKNLYENKKQLEIYLKIHHLAIKDEEDRQRFFETFGNICDSICIENLCHIFPGFHSEGERMNMMRYDDNAAERWQICATCFKILNINADGSCAPCTVDWEHKVIIGNILENSLVDIWNGKPLRELQKRFCSNTIDKSEACYDCMDYVVSRHENMDEYADEILKRLD